LAAPPIRELSRRLEQRLPAFDLGAPECLRAPGRGPLAAGGRAPELARPPHDVLVPQGRQQRPVQPLHDPGRRALPWLRVFVEEMKATGFVARALAESGQADAEVAPASP